MRVLTFLFILLSFGLQAQFTIDDVASVRLEGGKEIPLTHEERQAILAEWNAELAKKSQRETDELNKRAPMQEFLVSVSDSSSVSQADIDEVLNDPTTSIAVKVVRHLHRENRRLEKALREVRANQRNLAARLTALESRARGR